MKITYLISDKIRETYKTSYSMAISKPEERRVVAENFEWDDDYTPAPLTFLSSLVLSQIFIRINPLNDILQKDVDSLMDLYPTDIPLKYSVPLIQDQHYWMRCCKEKFPTRPTPILPNWKNLYLSACLQEYLENVNPDVFRKDEACTLTRLVAPYIFDLYIGQLLMVRQPVPPIPSDIIQDSCVPSVPKVYDHLTLEPVLVLLYNLVEICLVFGISNLEDKYMPRYYEFSWDDCKSVANGVENLNSLKIIRINRSNLDCYKVKILLQKLIKKNSIEELDFNHCKIGDYGMQVIGGFLFHHTNLRILRLANNRFKNAGVQGIAYALQMKPAAPIELIDLSLNTMNLECATMMAAALVRGKEKPQTVMMNACGFSGDSAEKIAGILSLNRGLTRLDISANDFSGEAEVTLVESLEKNKQILHIDLRRTNISQDTVMRVNELLESNNRLVGIKREPSEEIPPLYLNEPEYLIWEYNPNNPDYVPGRYPERVAEV